MAPEMIDLFDDLDECRIHPTVYVVMEEWGNDDGYNRVHQICTDYNDAKRLMNQQLKDQMEDDDIQRWRDDDAFTEEFGPDSYEYYIDGEYSENTTLFPSLPNDPRLPEKLKNALGANDFY